jgi:hypothetical protein
MKESDILGVLDHATKETRRNKLIS